MPFLTFSAPTSCFFVDGSKSKLLFKLVNFEGLQIGKCLTRWYWLLHFSTNPVSRYTSEINNRCKGRFWFTELFPKICHYKPLHWFEKENIVSKDTFFLIIGRDNRECWFNLALNREISKFSGKIFADQFT